MNRSLPILCLFLVILPLVLAGPPLPDRASPTPTDALWEEIEALKEKYRNTTMPDNSPDRAVFKRIYVAAPSSESAVEALIDLTTIRLSPPGTTERITAFSESPAAGTLFSLGDIAKPHIEARLAGDELTALQREILSEVLFRWERQAESKRIDAEFWKTQRAEEARQAAEIGAAATEAMKGSSGENPDQPNPNGKLVRTMLVAAGALALVWLGIRWRVRMPHHT
jgi:hypothetical protein